MMAISTNTESNLDIQLQEIITLASDDAGGSGIHGMNAGHPKKEAPLTRVLPMSADWEIDLEAQPSTSTAAVPGSKDEIRATGIHGSSNDVTGNPAPSGSGHIENKAEAQGEAHPDPGLKWTAHGDSSIGRVPIDSTQESQVRMIGDFDDGANPLWTLYGKEAKSHDEANIHSLKGDMDGVLIFAGLFSAALTALINNSVQNLQPNPAQQTAYYMQQNVAMLAQISEQIASIAPQVTIPPIRPPPFPPFNPFGSNRRVNVFWFMALVFSLSAALLAILVQQWIRDYMHVFQRYNDPLKSARLRQYLYDGCEGWYMPALAEAVPGLLHVSLFLFFIGLIDFVLNLNTTVGVCTAIPICLCGLFYIFTIFAPVIYPQSPYQNSFSRLIWYLVQRLHARRYKDRSSNGTLKPVSSNMAEGQMQLAMEETEERKGRDKTAIRWLVDNMTEDTEIESFTMAIPGSFNTEWGGEVWKGMVEDENKRICENELAVGPLMNTTLPPLPTPLAAERVSTVRSFLGSIPCLDRTRSANNTVSITRAPRLPPNASSSYPASLLTPGQDDYTVCELSRRVARLLETCNDRGRFANEELWRQRTRACVQTSALLVCANVKIGWFADIGKMLQVVGSLKSIYVHSMEELDQLSITPWTCLSIMIIRVALDDESLRECSRIAVSAFAHVQSQDGTPDDQAVKNAQKIDRDLNIAWDCLPLLRRSLCVIKGLFWEPAEYVRARENLRSHERQIFQLGRINIEANVVADAMEHVEACIADVYHEAYRVTRRLPCQLPVRSIDPLLEPAPSGSFTIPIEQQSTSFHRRLREFSSLYPKLRDIVDGRNSEEYEETMRNVRWQVDFDRSWPISSRCPLENQLARLQDLCDGGGFGCIVELFFLTLEKLASTSSSWEPHQGLLVLTLKNITSDWKKYKHSLGTQKVILEIFCDVAIRPCRQESNPDPTFLFPEPIAIERDVGKEPLEPNFIPGFPFPSPIAGELLRLLQNLLEGETGPHIDRAVERLRAASTLLPNVLRDQRGGFLRALLEVMTRCEHIIAPHLRDLPYN